MKTLLVINDNSPEAKHAAEFAVMMAKRMGYDITLANNFIKVNKCAENVPAGDFEKDTINHNPSFDLPEYLKELNKDAVIHHTKIEEIDISDMDETKLAAFINLNHTWMIVRGVPGTLPSSPVVHPINVQTVLNKVLCPLLLVPQSWQLKDIERLVYIADLRYCRIPIVNYMAEIATPWLADLSIAHISASGLPDMVEKYALSVFSEGICPKVKYENIFFNNIREKNLLKAVDVIIHGMHNDILVLVNHRFHFEEIVGRYITDPLPVHLTLPLLIFPY